ncbi:MAG: 2,3-bisphosphoglycerate-independent phosphoglycerate mutase [Phycisphaerae bacterium]|nr:2,3-bisphosphoglycerate-independent phosphoglycerate mutase [Phycisphaerae bacterium]
MRLTHRPIVLIVRDGWGANPYPQWNHANAVHLAKKPITDRLMAEYPHVQIRTSGEDVGLPAGVMGNSEVGHQNIGAGRIVDQEIMRITRTIRNGQFFENTVLQQVYERARRRQGRVHLMGLCSSAGVHSVLEHAYALLQLGAQMNFPGDKVFLHCFGDGRDTSPKSGLGFLREIEQNMKKIGVGRVASVVGRFYAMDRDNRWDRVEKAYRLLTEAAGHRCRSAEEAFQRYYDHPTDAERQGDEFIEPTVIVDSVGQPLATIQDGDSVIFFNFRGDRPREISKAFVNDEFPFQAKDKTGEMRNMGFSRSKKLDLFYATMTEYEESLPVQVAFPKSEPMKGLLGDYVSQLGLKQLRSAETEKFPHVTFFFNDYRDEPFPGEDRYLVASPRDVTTYDQKPEMSARPVAEEVVRRIASGVYDLIVINFANGDMVGHTGSLPAAIKAVETVDHCVGLVVEATLHAGGGLIVTADHGNCEQMIDPETGGPHTSHTTYDVELLVVDPRFQKSSLRSGGRLADIAPTLLQMMGLEPPREMTGSSFIVSA